MLHRLSYPASNSNNIIDAKIYHGQLTIATRCDNDTLNGADMPHYCDSKPAL